MSYQLMRVIQLVFALSLMFGAFLGGLAVGWWRWGRRSDEPRGMTSHIEAPITMPRVNPDLFTPADTPPRPAEPVTVAIAAAAPAAPAAIPPAELTTVDPFG